LHLINARYKISDRTMRFAGENVPSTARPSLVACRWRSD